MMLLDRFAVAGGTMARVFVSHASNDRELADQVHRWLTEDGHQVFLDQDLNDGIAVGEEWEQRLYERLRWADAVVCVVTSAYLASPWCAAEVGIARAQGSRLLPLLAEPGVAHPLLTSTQYTRLDRDPVAARAALSAALRRIDAAGGWGWPDDRSPFPGLRPFDIDQHRVFFGRAAEIETLAGLLRSPAERAGGGMLLVVGPSGCGKSSLVRAGLVPVIANESGWWTLPPFLPGADPVRALGRELAAAARQVGLDWTLAQVRDRLHNHGLGALADELLLAAPGEGRRRRLLVVVDQFEELLTQTSPAARTWFAELLRPALDHPVQLVATLRPEFLAQLLVSPDLAGLPTRLFTLRPLHRDALPTVIEGPARLAGIEIDEQLVERLVADTDTGEALPLLAFTLQQLAVGIGRGGRLSATRYEQLGGVQGALVRQADAALAGARGASGRSAGAVMSGLLRLVTVDEQGRPTRWRVDRGELSQPVRAELDAFVARRLLATDTDDGATVVEVTHEAFLSAWRPLAEAIAAAASALRARRAVEQAAAEWDDDRRPPSRLWERGQLAAVVNDTGARTRRAGLVTDKVELSHRARDFLHASIRRDRRRRARATTILSALLVLALTATGLAFTQQRAARREQRVAEERAKVATSRELAAQATLKSDRQPAVALLQSLKALQTADTVEARSSLLAGLHLDPRLSSFLPSTSTVWAVAFGPDGRTVASGNDDGRLLLWDVQRRQESGPPLTGHTDAVLSVAFSPDGRVLASASRDNTVILWDVQRRRQLGKLTGHTSWVVSVAFSSDGRTLATASDDKTVILWDVQRLGKPLTGHTEAVDSVAFSPDGRTLATGSADYTVALWDVRRRQMLGKPLTGHTDVVWDVAFSPDGRTLATVGGGSDQTVILWDVQRHQQVGKPLTGHTNSIWAVEFSPNGRTLVTASDDNTVILWDVQHRRQLGKPLTGHTNSVLSVAFSPDGRTLATGSGDNTVALWDVRRRLRLGRVLTGHTDYVYGVTMSADGRTLASGSRDSTVLLWDVQRRQQLGKLSGHTDAVWAVAFSPDGRTLATGSPDGTVILWDVQRRQQIGKPLKGHTDAVESVAFSPDGRTLASGSDDKSVILWDVQRRQRLGRLTGHDDAVLSVAFNPDGRTLASGSRDNTVLLWDVQRRRQIGKRLLGHNNGVTSVAFSPDGRTLASGSFDESLILWDVERRQQLGPLLGDMEGVWSVTFSPDGRILASASDDKTVVLWDVQRRQQLGKPLTGHTDAVLSVAFSPDGRTLASGSRDNTVVLWETDVTSWQSAACGVVGPLTRHESAPQWSPQYPSVCK
jgi:WD40 repeat protein/energy-coupling factor transporter ATP-binding protein EcfA2